MSGFMFENVGEESPSDSEESYTGESVSEPSCDELGEEAMLEAVGRIDLDQSLAQVLEYRDQIYSEDITFQIEGTTQIRRLLSNPDTPPIWAVVESNCLPRLIEFLSSGNHILLREATWVVMNVCSGESEFTQAAVDGGSIPRFIGLSRHRNLEIATNAIWALGNIAGDGVDMREAVLKNGAVPALVDRLIAEDDIEILKNGVFLLNNLCRGSPPPDFDLVLPALDVLSSLLEHKDESLVGDACWVLSFISSDADDRLLQRVLGLDLTDKLVEFLSNPSFSIYHPSLRTIGNLVTGSDEITQYVLDLGILPKIHKLLARVTNDSATKECIWLLSNIAAGSRHQIQLLIESGLIEVVAQFLHNHDQKIMTESAWFFANLFDTGSGEQIEVVLRSDMLPSFVELIKIDSKILRIVILEGLTSVLKKNYGSLERALKVENRILKTPIKYYAKNLLENNIFEIQEKAQRLLRILSPSDVPEGTD